MITFLKGLIKRLPGISKVVAERDQLATDLERERTERRQDAQEAAAQAYQAEQQAEQQAEHQAQQNAELLEKVQSVKAKLAEERDRAARKRNVIEAGREALAEVKKALAAERAEKQELRQKIQAREWKPGYAMSPDYEAARDRFAEHCVNLGKLPVDGKVLDMGCGIGGVAQGLAEYMSADGIYEGLDVLDKAIEQAQANVGDAYPNFHFQLADVYNNKYHPEGSQQPNEYKFPFPDDTFDLTILRSVFTHMLPPEVEHYVSEIARTLKPGGRCLITYFLLNEESWGQVEAGTSRHPFDHGEGIYRLSDPDRPEARVGLDEEWVHGLYSANVLEIAEPTLCGGWRRPGDIGLDGQDLVTAQKKA